MPVKILLADKSITIQKVVEMLFSGKEYEVTCVSDGESAFGEATRVVPDVVLADVDLPRIDGYTFANKLKETPALAKVPVVLMLSRDDVYDAMKGKLAGIVDNIAKPFESQDLIGKVKKALSAAPPAAVETPAAASSPKPAVAQPKPAAVPPPPPKPVVEPPAPPKPAVAPPPPPKPFVEPPAPPKPAVAPPPPPKAKEPVPSDIFDIIEEAPAKTGPAEAPVSPQKPSAAPQEETFEVEPEFEVEVEPEPEQPEAPKAASPVPAPKEDEWSAVAVEPEEEPAPAPAAAPMHEPPSAAPDAFDTDHLFGKEPEASSVAPAPEFESSVEADVSPAESAPPSFDFSAPMPSEAEEALPLGQKAMDEMREGLGLGGEEAPQADRHPDIVSFESLDMASRAGHEDYTFVPPPAQFGAPSPAPAPAPTAGRIPAAPVRAPEVSDEMLKGVAREVIEKAVRDVLERVAWEVIPDLAERLIREEIERLKSQP